MLLDRAAKALRSLRRRYRERNGVHSRDPVAVQVYRGYRSSTKLFVQARVLEDEGVSVAASDRRLRNVANALRSFESDEVPGARVHFDYRGQTFERVADDEGYLYIHADVEGEASPEAWDEIDAELLEVPFERRVVERTFTGEVADLSREARFAVVTDIDDTLLKTHITSPLKLRALWHTLVDNAHTRVAFEGAAELYRALNYGPEGERDDNPVFYLSRSPWNLYGMLESFLDNRDFPRGPIFLRDVGLGYLTPGSEAGHKVSTLLRLVDDFPGLPFVLVGDSGERDADIYLSVAARHPERIAAIVIRNVKDNRNARRIAALFARRAGASGPPCFLVRDSAEAAERLAGLGLVNPQQARQVAASLSRGRERVVREELDGDRTALERVGG